MAVVGGAGSAWGAVVGASLITLAKQLLQDLLPSLLGKTGNFEIVVFGVLMVILLQRAPDGVWPWLARLFPPRRRASVADATPLAPRGKAIAAHELLHVGAARKEFGGLVAVNDLSFAIRRGEILGLIGPNGAGKSTMFNLISGALPLTAGTIMFCGQSIGNLPPFEIARRGISRTFQHVKLMPQMSVRDNVALGAYLRGSSGVLRAALKLDAMEERRTQGEALRAIARVGLGAHADDSAESLPLGRQRIVEIARALAADPMLLLLDEPAAGLRLLEKRELAALLRQLRDEGMTILLVEHDMDFVMDLTDRLVVMDFGEKLAEGLPRDIQRDPRRARSLSRKRRVADDGSPRSTRSARRLRQGRSRAQRVARRACGPDRHGHRSQWRGQDDAACRVDGLVAVARRRALSRRERGRIHRRAAGGAGNGARSRASRTVRRDERR
jgi:branched-chain amino acid transport system permease protein